jgi:hypothetical protein
MPTVSSCAAMVVLRKNKGQVNAVLKGHHGKRQWHLQRLERRRQILHLLVVQPRLLLENLKETCVVPLEEAVNYLPLPAPCDAEAVLLVFAGFHRGVRRRGLHLAMERYDEARRLANSLQSDADSQTDRPAKEDQPTDRKPLVS